MPTVDAAVATVDAFNGASPIDAAAVAVDALSATTIAVVVVTAAPTRTSNTEQLVDKRRSTRWRRRSTGGRR